MVLHIASLALFLLTCVLAIKPQWLTLLQQCIVSKDSLLNSISIICCCDVVVVVSLMDEIVALHISCIDEQYFCECYTLCKGIPYA